MNWQAVAWALCVLTLADPMARAEAPIRRSFAYDRGRPSSASEGLRTHEATFPGVEEIARIYATVAPLPANPIVLAEADPRGVQRIMIGQTIRREFVPAIRFGVVDSGRCPRRTRRCSPSGLRTDVSTTSAASCDPRRPATSLTLPMVKVTVAVVAELAVPVPALSLDRGHGRVPCGQRHHNTSPMVAEKMQKISLPHLFRSS